MMSPPVTIYVLWKRGLLSVFSSMDMYLTYSDVEIVISYVYLKLPIKVSEFLKLF